MQKRGGGTLFFSHTLEPQPFSSSLRTSSTSDVSCAESSSFRHAQHREDRRVEENKNAAATEFRLDRMTYADLLAGLSVATAESALLLR